jgi:hypothetical protein
MVILLIHYAHAATSCTTAVRSTQQRYDNRTATNQRCQLNEWLAGPPRCSAMHTAQQRTASSTMLTQQIVYMITVQLQTKMYSWNEWLRYALLG